MSDFEIDSAAPVRAKAHLTIAAAPDAVWAALTDVAAWPEWVPGVSAAKLQGPVAVGSVIYWTANDMQIESRLVAADPNRLLVWHGSLEAVHVWALSAEGSGTLLTNSESIGSSFPGLTPEATSEQLQGFLEIWNSTLAARAKLVHP